MTEIEQSVMETISNHRKASSSSKELEEMELSIKAYNKMVSEGLAKPRGYNIRTVNDTIRPIIYNHQ